MAPGDRGWSLCSSDTTHFHGCADIDHGANPPPIWAAGGTSASAPETSGTAALVISAYEQAHGGTAPSPELVEQIIVSSAQDLGAPADRQGAGLVNTLKAVQLAETIDGGTSRRATPLFVRQTTLSATVAAGQHPAVQRRRHQRGQQPPDGHPDGMAGRRRGQRRHGHVNLSSASPTYVDGEGNTDSYAAHTFTVPAGADYLTGDITWTRRDHRRSGVRDAVRPAGPCGGLLADRTRPERIRPRRGPQADGRHLDRGDLHRQQRRAVQRPGSVPLLRPAVQPARARRPRRPGRSRPGTRRTSASSCPPGRPGTRRSGCTSGRARAPTGASRSSCGRWCRPPRRAARSPATSPAAEARATPARTFTYQFRVPDGKPSLNVGLQLADPNYELHGTLVDPNGQPLDVQDTAQFDASGTFLGFGQTLQFNHGHPHPGLWTMNFTVISPCRRDAPERAVHRLGLVRATGGVQPRRARLGAYHADRRAAGHGDDQRDQHGQQPQGLPGRSEARPPGDPVPDGQRRQPRRAAAVVHRYSPTGWSRRAPTRWPRSRRAAPDHHGHVIPVGDPDFGGPSVGNGAINQLAAPEIAPGQFFALPEATGPDGATGVPPGSTVNLAAVANTFPFDTSVNSTTGDFWLLAVQPTTSFTPLHLTPGQSGTDVTPTGQAARRVPRPGHAQPRHRQRRRGGDDPVRVQNPLTRCGRPRPRRAGRPVSGPAPVSGARLEGQPARRRGRRASDRFSDERHGAADEQCVDHRGERERRVIR